MRSPTPHVSVNAVLLYFARNTRAILGPRFLGFYLYGSLALGDFDPETSDLDWIVVTHGEVTPAQFNALQELHAAFDRSDSPWAGRIEAAYIPLEALNHPVSGLYPQVEKGIGLFHAPLEPGWAFQRHTLREHGVVVDGPDPGLLIAPVPREELRLAVRRIVEEWLDASQQDPGWIAWARRWGNLSFVVLALCRLNYSLETGAVASKPAAARWALQNSGGCWSRVIEKALAGVQGHPEASETDLEDMLALLRATNERAAEAAHNVGHEF